MNYYISHNHSQVNAVQSNKDHHKGVIYKGEDGLRLIGRIKAQTQSMNSTSGSRVITACKSEESK